MNKTKHIVLFGAGKSATVLIEYLKNQATENNWQLTVADSNLEAAKAKVGEHALATAVAINIEDAAARKALVAQADVVISMMPHALHYLIALDCLELNKHLLTASYVSEDIQALASSIKEKNLLFLCEMGLDPGIDHMSAMQIFDTIKKAGGKITSFKSHCGGLVAPESDDNPWHYKISWNPRNIILAGKAGAVYKENGQIVDLKYEALFNPTKKVALPNGDAYAYYPNRDSLGYIDLYKLPDVATFIRTTLRHPDFSFGWKNIIDLHLTDETPSYETDGLTVAAFFKAHFKKYGFGDWLNEMLKSRLDYAREMMEKLMVLMNEDKSAAEEGLISEDEMMFINDKGALTTVDIDDVRNNAAASVADKMHEANLSMKQLFFLGLDDETLINKGLCSAADVLQFILEKKLALKPEDKDMIVMLHEIEYVLNEKIHTIKSSLVVKGDDSLHTAMAKTVGLPLGIAATLILKGSLQETGLHIPVTAAIYEPVLAALQQQGIIFEELETQ
ncbi:saccharopine dehydrogenase C-terminal domain-containing protein [Limnovirga soli]|uniref:Saccharopine dehydrogenase n=1 Tax=Limnovirga soli TaxID=2656915 RepID=A0A8J8FKF9_9BACT|nr:saccharopine dehydrogenase C-terminal domain-containing protein [Limnovirga soli]NNV57526.1 saccharopine dehydrogenase [Limnovirga soli]